MDENTFIYALSVCCFILISIIFHMKKNKGIMHFAIFSFYTLPLYYLMFFKGAGGAAFTWWFYLFIITIVHILILAVEIFKILRNHKNKKMKENKMLEINKDCTDEFGRNLLQEAISSCRNDIAIDLINKGIDINHQDNKGLSPLHFCTQYNNITIAELLLQKGVNVNMIDIYGNNPLWYAVFNGDYHLVKLLIKYGADAQNKNNAMRSPLDFAKQIEDTEMTTILMENM